MGKRAGWLVYGRAPGSSASFVHDMLRNGGAGFRASSRRRKGASFDGEAMSGAEGAESAVRRVDSEDGRTILEMRNISKTFHTVKALRNVSFSVRAGELHALMGENGAGKSTLIKVLSGAYPPDPGGEILIDGAPVATGDPIAARANGVAVIYQELSLAPNLTVAKNIFLGNEPSRLGIPDRAQSRERSRGGPREARRSRSPPAPACRRCRSASGRWSRSPGRSRPTRASSSWTSRPPRCPRARPRSCSVSSPRSRRRASQSSTSATAWRRFMSSPTASRVLRDGGYVGTLDRVGAQRAALVVDDGRPRPLRLLQEGSSPPPARQARGRAIGARTSPTAPACRTARSTSIGARCWVWPAWSAPAAPSWRADLRRRPRTWRRDPDRRQAGRRSVRRATRSTPGLAYLTEDRKALGLFLDMSRLGQHQHGRACQETRMAGVVRNLAAAARRADAAITALSIRAPVAAGHARLALGRQSAEGAAGPSARDSSRGPHPRRADPRRRRRREVGDLPADRRAGENAASASW